MIPIWGGGEGREEGVEAIIIGPWDYNAIFFLTLC